MRINLLLFFALMVFLAIPPESSVSAVYDVNGDGQEGLAETIHSLKVAAGLSPSVSSTIYVRPVGTKEENGQLLLDIAGTITDASVDNPYLLKILPGIYDIGDASLLMQEYIDIEGSGKNVTIITSTNSGNYSSASPGTISGANNAELRSLTIENRGNGVHHNVMVNFGVSPQITDVKVVGVGGKYNWAIYNRNASPKMNNIDISVSGGDSSTGIYNTDNSTLDMDNITIDASSSADLGSATGIFCSNSEQELTNFKITSFGNSSSYGIHSTFCTSSITMGEVTALPEKWMDSRGISNTSDSVTTINTVTATGASGVYNFVATTDLINVTVTGTEAWAVRNISATTTIKNSIIISPPNTSSVSSTNSTIYVAASMLKGEMYHSDCICVGAYDDNFLPLNSTCHAIPE